ncbi:T-cell surface glycoprotein CD3 epsilon chain isoform X2 [Pelodiscus sinensis]|uniref:T-cell surface glycoprotein CD3 epsilon chain isoform X2 n=1 Tax=Pelodiscus sinensis TaxID=13735 RepID=UPI003F6A5AED
MQHLRGEAVEESQPGHADLIGEDRRQSERGDATMKLAHTLLVMGLLLCVAGITAQEPENQVLEPFQVMISKTTVTLTCLRSSCTITHNEKVTPDCTHVIKNYKSSQDDGEYHCESSGVTVTLYLKAKVCESCVELDPLTVAGIIIADLLITLGVLVLAYYFSKNRKGRGGGGSGGRAGGHPRGQKMVRPPPVPNPDYEPIRKGQREVYAGLDSRGF